MDVVIVGAGIAGPALGVALARAGLSAQILEARGPGDQQGAFLTLAPNGINALAAVGLRDVVTAAGGIGLTGIRFHNAAGREIGHLDGTDELARYGARNHLVLRAHLHDQLRQAAQDAGVRIRYATPVTEVREADSGVTVRLANGEIVAAAMVLGADGVHSAVRRSVFASGPAPTYTSILNCGGWAPIDLPDTHEQRMVFGRRGFFGYVVHDRIVYWFSNLARPQDPTAADRQAFSGEDWLARLREVHADDPHPVPQILAAATSLAGVWPVYDVAELPTWQTARVCLLGDAAHATSPNAGQGASLALEDAVVLAKCLRDIVDPSEAFAAFERVRKPRAEAVVKLSRRFGRQTVPSPAAAWLRDRLLPILLKAGAAQTRNKYGYRIEFDTPINASRSARPVY